MTSTRGEATDGAGRDGRCPSCGSLGPIGEPCPERVCSLRGYHRVPALYLPPAPGPGAAPDATLSGDLLVGQMVDEFLIVRPLGAGGFGKVYVAMRRPDGLQVALKLVNLDDASPQLAAVKLQKFDIEVAALARLSHPNIVGFIKAGMFRNAPYFVMELVDNGCTLAEEIEVRAQNEVPFEIPEVAQILRQVASALSAAHAAGMIHRDMKPENIMLVPRGQNAIGVKVVDFGLAKLAENRTATTMLLGTPAYMAPEQLRRDQLGPWTDVYAFGVIAFELLTGRRPFPGIGVQATIALKLDPNYDPWSQVAHAGYPPELQMLFSHALAADVSARTASIDDLMPLLDRAVIALGKGHAVVELVPLLEQTEIGVHLPTGPSTRPKPRPELLVDPTRRMQRPLGIASRGHTGHNYPAARPPAGDDAGLPPTVTAAVSVPAPVVSSPIDKDVKPAEEPRRSWWWLVAVLALVGGGAAVFFATRASDKNPEAVPASMLPGFEGGAPVTRPKLKSALVELPAGRLQRGSPPGEAGRREDEELHDVRLRQNFFIQATEVTQGAWLELMQTRPWSHVGCGETCPVDGVSWWDALAYANALSTHEGRASCYTLEGCTGTPGNGDYKCQNMAFAGVKCEGWRLPTEAEWEFAARVSKARPDSRAEVSAVGTGAPNATGIDDMLGNLREWVHDAYGPYDVGKTGPGEMRDPTGPAASAGGPTGAGASDRVVRGGSFMTPPELRRAAARDRAPPAGTAPDLGFRLVRTNSH